MIKHEVDDNAGHGDIEPHRERVSRDAAMAKELSSKRACQSNDYERHDSDGQYRVRNQDDHVEGSNPSRSAKPGHTRFVADVIRDV